MKNFTYLNSTKIIFGRETENKVGAETKKCYRSYQGSEGKKNINNIKT